MKTLPRPLFVQVIIDLYSQGNVDQHVPTYLELCTPSIVDWRSAIEFWTGHQPDEHLDLIVADVLFENDDTTPLYNVAPPVGGLTEYNRPIPTGLSHFKPFAAIARYNGRIHGTALQTAHPDMWEKLIDLNHDMGKLAAAEIGEIAAILGHDLVGDSDDPTDHGPIFEWLRSRAETGVTSAIYKALTNYRQNLVRAARDESLPRIFVTTAEWTRLMKWITERAGNGAGLTEEDGLEFIYSDGRAECISIRSLFADHPDIDRDRTLLRRCFEIDEQDESPWLNTDNGDPKIGTLIHAIGRIPRTCEIAAQRIGPFPITFDPENDQIDTALNEAVETGDAALVRGLAVLYQIVRWERARYDAWQTTLLTPGWCCREARLRPEGGATNNTSLFDVLTLLHRILPDSPEDADSTAQILDDHLDRDSWPFPDAPPTIPKKWRAGADEGEWDINNWKAYKDPALLWHFNLLVELGIAGTRPIEGDPNVLAYYKRLHHIESANLRAPDSQPDGIDWPREGCPWTTGARCQALNQYLADSLGFGRLGPRKDGNAIPSMVSRAFLNTTAQEQPKAGRGFIQHLLAGEAPQWVRLLLRDYANSTYAGECGWPTAAWPSWLTDPDRNDTQNGG